MRSDLDHRHSSLRDTLTDEISQRLRELPPELQPPFDWTEFRRRGRVRAWPQRRAVKWQHAAVAAGLTMFIAGMAMLGRTEHATSPMEVGAGAGTDTSMTLGTSATPGAAALPSSQSARAGVQYDVAVPVPNSPEAPQPVHGPALAATSPAAVALATAAQATASRRWLARQPPEPAVVRVGTRLAVANLEDRIAWVDDALTDEKFADVDPARAVVLQRERARLVNSLAQVRYAETLAARVP